MLLYVLLEEFYIFMLKEFHFEQNFISLAVTIFIIGLGVLIAFKYNWSLPSGSLFVRK